MGRQVDFVAESELVGSVHKNWEVWYVTAVDARGFVFRYETNAKDEAEAEKWAESFQKRVDPKWHPKQSVRWEEFRTIYSSPAYESREAEYVYEERMEELSGEQYFDLYTRHQGGI